MQYRKFGNTGIDISTLGFGAMRLPMKVVDDKNVLDYEAGINTIHRAFELGVNYIDTAPYYCDKESEIVVGKALKGWRDKVYVSTKYPVEDAIGDNLKKSLEKSLNQLDIDYIDFYHLWGISWDTFVNKINVKNGPLEAAQKAKDEGLIKHISFSFHDKPENLFKLIDTGFFESVLCQYNLLDLSNAEGIAYAASKGLGTVIMGPVAGGRLGTPIKQIKDLMKEKSSSSAEIALRFVIATEGVNCALSGMENIEMVEENVKTCSNSSSLTPKEYSLVKKSMEENKKLADLYCTGCNYCMPCPSEVNIPLNFQIMNYHKVYNITEYAKKEYAKIGVDEWMKGKKASACIECGLCEEKCPQKIAIIKQLKETALELGSSKST